jgi:hypothetical protein
MKVKTVPDVFGASSFSIRFRFYLFFRPTLVSLWLSPHMQLHFQKPKKPHSPLAAFAIGDDIPGPVDEIHEEKHS